jgi:hypothetical protein
MAMLLESRSTMGKTTLACKSVTVVFTVFTIAVGIVLAWMVVLAFDLGQSPVSLGEGIDIRVSKGFGTRAYNIIRISSVTTLASPPIPGVFDYSEPFMHKWEAFYLHSALKEATPGASMSFDIGTNLTVRLPKQGSGVAGVLIADPCVNSPTGRVWQDCPYGDAFLTISRTPALINAFVGDEATDFWGILGDNFYDRTGEITWDVFRRISIDAKSKLFIAVPGNHDYWVYGEPWLGTTVDQCGNGFMQYYVQDTKAAEMVTATNGTAPINCSIRPDAGRFLGLQGCNLPDISNFFWYQQIGNVGLVGQSGAYSLEDTRPFMVEACAWFGAQPGLALGVLFGHWDQREMGAETGMAMPQWYLEMTALPGCAELHELGRLKYFTGHTHCNNPLPGNDDAGFRVAGFGMAGCGNYGVPILDTTNGRVRIWYFDTSTDYLFSEVIECVKRNGWKQCTNRATLWLDQPLGLDHGVVT